MPVNLDKPLRWKADVAASVDMYNKWFLEFAPVTFRQTRITATQTVEASLKATSYLRDIKPATIKSNPSILSTLRMATCPPLAVDRLIGLSGVDPNVVKSIEKKGVMPSRMAPGDLNIQLEKIADIIERMADPDLFVWLERGGEPTDEELYRSATIVADRLCGAQANPIIRNEQEKRQLAGIRDWLLARGYQQIPAATRVSFLNMPPGTFSFRLNVPVDQPAGNKQIMIPVDAVIKPLGSSQKDFPVLIEAKSAGDFTNTNKRRKEEATKMAQLRYTYEAAHGEIHFALFLCGYFDTPYLGYEAAEGIDWVWEHRIDDLAGLGL